MNILGKDIYLWAMLGATGFIGILIAFTFLQLFQYQTFDVQNFLYLGIAGLQSCLTIMVLAWTTGESRRQKTFDAKQNAINRRIDHLMRQQEFYAPLIDKIYAYCSPPPSTEQEHREAIEHILFEEKTQTDYLLFAEDDTTRVLKEYYYRDLDRSFDMTSFYGRLSSTL